MATTRCEEYTQFIEAVFAAVEVLPLDSLAQSAVLSVAGDMWRDDDAAVQLGVAAVVVEAVADAGAWF